MQDYSWYSQINKPVLTPPAEVFPIAWTILYTLMALSLFFFLKDGYTKDKTVPLLNFAIQLILNLSWSPVFFGMHNTKLALIIVLLMIVFTVFTITGFYKFSKTAGILLIPYLLWIIFAAYLNFEIIRLN